MIDKKIYTDDGKERFWSGYQILKLASTRRHHLDKKKFELLKGRGFVAIEGDDMVFKTIDGDRRFHIDHAPGCFCLHDEKEIPNYEWDSPNGHKDKGKKAREYVAKNFSGKKSPTPKNQPFQSHPAGYKVKNYYGLTAHDDVPQSSVQGDKIARRVKLLQGGTANG